MRVVLLTSFLIIGLSHFSTAQFKREYLTGTWIPILEQSYNGDTTSFGTTTDLLTFGTKDTLLIELPGSKSANRLVKFELKGDTLTLFNEQDSFITRLLEFNRNKLKIAYDSLHVISYAPLPDSGLDKEVKSVKKELAGTTWHFGGKQTNPLYHTQIEFLETLIDSSTIKTPFLPEVKNLRIQTRYNLTYQDAFWAVAKHSNVIILRLESVYDYPKTVLMIIKSLEKKRMQVEFWVNGTKKELTATKSNERKNFRRRRAKKLLTQNDWRFHKEIMSLPDLDSLEIIDLGSIRSYDQGQYHKDSTLLLYPDDFKKKQVILNFDQSGTYQIKRENRVLDKGNWLFMFDNKVLRLNSDRRNSEGLYGGFIFIEELNKGRLQIKREFKAELDFHRNTEKSNLEIYLPIKKRPEPR